jgi:uncharacterized tellurite resistance protein B-like protein
MFGRWLRPAREVPLDGAEHLENQVRLGLPTADEGTVRVVVAIAGLLAVIAYADRTFCDAEAETIAQELARIEGIDPGSVGAIVQSLRQHIVEHSAVQVPRYCRTLVELADRDLRLHVLSLLVDVAAADGRLTLEETGDLRRLTTSLGLSQADYNDAQARYRDRLSVTSGNSSGA